MNAATDCSNPGKLAGVVCIALFWSLLESCTRPAVQQPITLTFLDQEWTTTTFNSEERERELREFKRKTGIQVKLLPSPESTREQLALWREVLRTGASGPDVYTVDVIWPSILNENFLDLKPYFANEASGAFPSITAAYTVDNKLVAVPYDANLGMLYYRTDLLGQYGYRAPPQTWDELESMAARIQAGERAKGKKDFWGFVWQGAATEALTCNALEWQASEGGGQIIEQDQTISVNNPQAIQAWQRAAGWVGSISPPSVVGYKEWDALNVWVAGNAAFMRNWTLGYVDSQAPRSLVRNKFDIGPLPGGKARRVTTLGGNGLAISRFSAHPREALALVRYFTSRDVQVRRSKVFLELPTRPELYEQHEVLEPNPHFAALGQALRTDLVSRPSTVTGKKYEDVAKVYIQAIHSVLTGEKSAPEAASSLEKQLVLITGFRKAPPPGTNRAAPNRSPEPTR
ncbi:MAG: Maltose/maltodextrin transporter, substrate binding periplasmic protein MalE [Bryobacterales bacterium]|nr:Maltose/maltodextrin transporter, substrate binding periplasmic protein MalE [Bryobacterales bacterium]